MGKIRKSSKKICSSKFFEPYDDGGGIRIIIKAKLTKLLLIFNGFINFNDVILELI